MPHLSLGKQISEMSQKQSYCTNPSQNQVEVFDLTKGISGCVSNNLGMPPKESWCCMFLHLWLIRAVAPVPQSQMTGLWWTCWITAHTGWKLISANFLLPIWDEITVPKAVFHICLLSVVQSVLASGFYSWSTCGAEHKEVTQEPFRGLM